MQGISPPWHYNSSTCVVLSPAYSEQALEKYRFSMPIPSFTFLLIRALPSSSTDQPESNKLEFEVGRVFLYNKVF